MSEYRVYGVEYGVSSLVQRTVYTVNSAFAVGEGRSFDEQFRGNQFTGLRKGREEKTRGGEGKMARQGE